MSSVIQWPFQRQVYDGLLNPRFVSDVQAANQAVLDGLMNILGLNPTDFYIFAGFTYTPGSPGSYTAGVFYLNGSFYYMPIGFTDGQALQPNLVNALNEPFPDGNGRPIYTLQQATAVNAVVGGTTSPLFAAGMNQYRLDSKTLLGLITAIQTTLGGLKSGAFAAIGTTPGTVAAGDDSRFGYSVAQINALFALQVDVLIEGSTNNNFVPTQPFDPATKQYVDNSNPKRLAAGNTNVGNIGTGLTVNISFGLTLGNANYICLPSLISLSGNPTDDAVTYAPDVFNKTTTGCSIRLQRGVNVNTNISIDWIVFGF